MLADSILISKIRGPGSNPGMPAINNNIFEWFGTHCRIKLYGGLSLIGKTAVLKIASNRDKRCGRSSRPPSAMPGCPSRLRSFTANEVVIENGSRVRISSLAFIKGILILYLVVIFIDIFKKLYYNIFIK